MEQISDILKIPKLEASEEVEKLRKSQFILMSPQRQEEKIVKIFEILPEGVVEIDKTETEGLDKIRFGEIKPEIEILSRVDEIIKEIQDTQLGQPKKDTIIKKLSELKNKLEI